MREIQHKLPKQDIVNPETGEPYSLGTISNDVTFVKKQWIKEAAADVKEVKAAQLAELKEARRKAWADGNVAEVRRNLDLETTLTGTKAPAQVDMTSKGEQIGGITVLSDAELAAEIAELDARIAEIEGAEAGPTPGATEAGSTDEH